MAERSRPWDDIVTGDAGPYSFEQWTDVWKTLLSPVIGTAGVFQDQLNALDLSGLPATPVDIASGRALVNGIWYESDASEAIAIPTPAANPRVDRIVLRADWALQTVRLTRIAGAEAAAPVPPAIVQVDGVTWDLPLWQVHTTVAAVITVFRDERSFIGQYVPIGVTDQRVYIESDFFLPTTTMGDADRFDNWGVEVVGTSVLNALDLAGFGAGAATFRYVGGGPGGTVNIRNRNHRPNDINAHLIIRAKSPNTDANLDRIMGFQDSAISLTPTNGVFWRADGAGNWFAVTRSAGVEAGSAIDTTQALDDVWRKFEIRQVSTDVVTFLIDDVVVVTNRINIPAASLFLRAGIFDDGGAPAVNDYLDVDRLTLRGDR
jgi:hypothetical protein